MKTFNINIMRTGYGFNTLEVEAETIEEALIIAEDQAGDLDYNEKSSEYSFPDHDIQKPKTTKH